MVEPCNLVNDNDPSLHVIWLYLKLKLIDMVGQTDIRLIVLYHMRFLKELDCYSSSP